MVKTSAVLDRDLGTNDKVKTLILSTFPDDLQKPELEQLDFGYVEPGHGLKGKKEWILDDGDLSTFKEICKGKKSGELTLWCHSKSEEKKAIKRPRSKSPSGKAGSSRYDAHTAKMAEVDVIYKSLDSTHGTMYSSEQKRAWAHLIQLGKHSSQSVPPNKPFFQRTQDKVVAVTDIQSRSPGKKVKIRSECIDQLQKWHSLLHSGAITKEQYEEFQSTILTDIRQL